MSTSVMGAINRVILKGWLDHFMCRVLLTRKSTKDRKLSGVRYSIVLEFENGSKLIIALSPVRGRGGMARREKKKTAEGDLQKKPGRSDPLYQSGRKTRSGKGDFRINQRSYSF